MGGGGGKEEQSPWKDSLVSFFEGWVGVFSKQVFIFAFHGRQALQLNAQ